MVAALALALLVLAAALTAVTIALRLAPPGRASSPLSFLAIVVATTSVLGYAVLAQVCVGASCIAAPATRAMNSR